MRNRELTIGRGVGAGLRFDTGNSNVSYSLGITEPPIQEALALCLETGQVFYDIGANVGFFTVIGARLVGPTGRVFAFEPVPGLAAMARGNIVRNRLHQAEVLELAVSCRAGEADLFLGAETTLAKLASVGVPAGAAASIRVRTVSIDQLVIERNMPAPDLVKIDVEGAEVDVCRGMAHTIAQHRPLVLCELHGTNLDIDAALAAAGYWQLVLEEPSLSSAEAPWYVHVLAGPPEKRFLSERVLASLPVDSSVSIMDI